MDVTPGPAADAPDDRDLDEGGLDLRPRTDDAPARRSPMGRRWGAIAVLAILAVVLVVIVVQARGASVFYKNADEAVAQQATLGSSNFRLQGTVVGDPQERTDDKYTRFTVAYNGVAVKVLHDGSEPALFKAGLPVVVEGHWNEAGTRFMSTRLLVKHTEDYQKKDTGDYEDKHPERVEEDEPSS